MKSKKRGCTQIETASFYEVLILSNDKHHF